MADFDQLSVHKSADSLSVHKARLARPRLGVIPPAEDDDEQDYEDDVPDSPSLDTEVQGRVDSIALAQKRLSAEKASRVDSPQPTKSRFGRVKLPEESPESDDKKIGVASGVCILYLDTCRCLPNMACLPNLTCWCNPRPHKQNWRSAASVSIVS